MQCFRGFAPDLPEIACVFLCFRVLSFDFRNVVCPNYVCLCVLASGGMCLSNYVWVCLRVLACV